MMIGSIRVVSLCTVLILLISGVAVFNDDGYGELSSEEEWFNDPSVQLSEEPGNITNRTDGYWYQVDAPYSTGMQLGSFLDDDGIVHISYAYAEYVSGSYIYHFRYGSFINNSWEIEDVDVSSQPIGTQSSIVIDDEGIPHIAYYDEYFDNLLYARKNGSDWDETIIEASGDSGSSPNIVLDSNGYPIISYYQYSGTTATRLARWNGTGWELSTVKRYTGGRNSMVIDSNDNLHISFQDLYTPFGLGYAYWNGTEWAFDTVDQGSQRGRHSSIALDRNGYPNILYQDGSQYDLKYATYNGTSWNVTTLDSSGTTGELPAIAMDSDYNPNIVFSDDTDDELVYMKWNGTAWKTEVIQYSYGFMHSVLLMDDRDVPLYYQRTAANDTSLNRLTFERMEVTSPSHADILVKGNTYTINWTTENLLDESKVDIDLLWFGEKILTIAKGIDSDQYQYNWTLPLDVRTGSHHRIRITYGEWNYVVDLTDEFMITQTKGWYFDVAYDNYGTHITMELDSNGYPNIGFISSGLKFARWNGTGWNVQTINPSSSIWYDQGMTLDSNDNPHFAYHDYSTNDLLYTFWNGTDWEELTVDSSGDVGATCSIALNSSDYPHIAYYDGSNKNLKYAVWNGRQFSTEIVDSNNCGIYPSIKINSTDSPYISYGDLSGNLRFASSNGSAWTISTASTSGNFDISMVIDSNDRPHIGYYGYYPYYTYWNGSSWNEQKIENSMYDGRHISLALDSNEFPHLVYQDDRDSTNIVRYSYWNGSSWKFEDLMDGGDYSSNSGPHSSILIDDSDTVHVSFLKNEGYDLVYAKKVGNVTIPSGPRELSLDIVNNEFELSWDPPLDNGGIALAGYQIFRGNSSSNMTLQATVGPSVNTYVDDDIINKMTYFYVIRALNSEGSSNASNLVSGTLLIDVLLVDDDEGHTLEQYFRNALNSTGYTHKVWDVYFQGNIDLANMSAYDSIIWTTGDRAANTLTSTDQANIMSYLDNSGRLYLSGQDFLYDLTGGSDGPITNTFVNDYLDITAVDNDVSYGSVSGVTGDVITGSLGSISLSSIYTIYGDELTVGSEAFPIFENPSTDNTAGIRVDNDTFRLVFTPFPFESLQKSNPGKGGEMMERILDWILASPGAPSPPYGLTTDAGNGFVNLSWTAPLDNGTSDLYEYRVYRRIPGISDFSIIARPGPSVNYYNDTTTSNNHAYEYYVTVNNSAAESPPSETVRSDTESPVFGVDSTPNSGTTGEGLKFSIACTDNVAMKTVAVEYWFGSGSKTNITMTGTGPYEYTIQVPSGFDDDLHYVFHASDVAGNWISSSSKTVTITDNDDPVLGTDNTPSSGTTGDGFTFSLAATDNIGIKNAYLEYWYGIGSKTNVTLTGSSPYAFLITIPDNSTDTLHYNFSVVDSAGNWRKSITKDVTIIDNDEPYFGIDFTSNIGYTGNIHTFTVQVFDNIGITATMLNLWYDGGINNQSTEMGGTYPLNSTTATLYTSLTGRLYYSFTAFDTSLNSYDSSVRAIDVYDDDHPTFSNDLTPATTTTGEDIQFSIEVADNIDVSEVTLEYRYGNDPPTNISLSGTNPYSKTISTRTDTISPLYYLFHASDSQGNWAQTVTKTISVSDNDLPEIINDNSDTTATTGDPLDFSVDIIDNVGISEVHLEYSVNGSSVVDIKMTGSLTYTYQALMPWNVTGSVKYRFGANDTSDNWNWTSYSYINLTDNDAPVSGTDASDISGTTGDPYNFRIAGTDNIAITVARVDYWFGTSPMSSMDLTGPSPYTGTIRIPFNSTDELHYVFIMKDEKGNNIATEEVMVTISDNDRPYVIVDETPDSVPVGDEIIFSLGLGDNIEVSNATIHYRYGDTMWFSSSMHFTVWGNWTYNVTTPSNLALPLHYFVNFSDTSGNWNTSDPSTVTIIDDFDPIFIHDWSAAEMTTGDFYTLSIQAYDNIGIDEVIVDFLINGEIYDEGEMEFIQNHNNMTDGIWRYSLRMPMNITGTVEIYLTITDTSGNWNIYGPITRNLSDNDPPEIGPDNSDMNATTGDAFGFNITSTDNIGIWTSVVRYSFDNITWTTANLTGEKFSTFEIDISDDPSQMLYYQFIITDTSYNSNSTDIMTREIMDNDYPTLRSINVEGVAYSGDTITISIMMQDPSGILNATMKYWYNEDRLPVEFMEIVKINEDGNFSFTVTIPSNISGYMKYIFEVNDNLENTFYRSGSIEIQDWTSPVIGSIENIVAYEGYPVNITLEISDNIGVTDIIWSGGPVPIWGKSFDWLADAPGDYQINITIMDAVGNTASTEFWLIVFAEDEDQDSDGIPDLVEWEYGLNKNDDGDALGDLDGDGLSNIKEYEIGTSLNNSDSDADGMPDLWEADNDLDPLIPSGFIDTDGDGETDLEEYLAGSDPNVKEEKGSDGPDMLTIILIVILILAIIVIIYLVFSRKTGDEESIEDEEEEEDLDYVDGGEFEDEEEDYFDEDDEELIDDWSIEQDEEDFDEIDGIEEPEELEEMDELDELEDEDLLDPEEFETIDDEEYL